uniref:Uncharacterized protein n=1 Tax=Meloidogyne enterolobii TaxID=390850 RepID=A0A6V7X302_MELEN|nr:unnamed protein product [Meloidogyne enterolobii]
MSTGPTGRFAHFLHKFQLYLTNNVEFTEKEKKEIYFRRISYFAFLFVVVVGLPVWWITTTPYRASLPYFQVDFTSDLEKRLLQFSPNKTENDEDNNVWNNLQLHSLYNIHLVFIHPQPEKFVNLSKNVLSKIDLFTKKILAVNGGVEINLSSEHLWDFSLKKIISKNKKLTDQQISAKLATALDRYILQPLGPEPLLKIAIFFENEKYAKSGENGKEEPTIRSVDDEGTLSTGLAIASWGGVCFHQNEADETILLNSIMGIIFKQLSIPPINNSNLIETLKQHQKRLTIYNLLQTLNSLNALNELASKIEDLVISDEVAGYAASAKFYFLKSYKQLAQNEEEIDFKSASKARYFAELANTHHSLLELLNFPSDQKYGVYVPLFFPLLVPLLQPLFLFCLFVFVQFKDYLRERREKKNIKKLE